MTHVELENEIARLESQWPRTYGQERKALLWDALKGTQAEDFHAAVDICLATHRSPPLLEQLAVEAEAAKVRRETSYARSTGGYYDTLKDAATHNKSADPEFVKACLAHLRKFLNREIDRKTFDEGCGYLDEVARKLSPVRRDVWSAGASVGLRLPPPKRHFHEQEKDNG